MRRIISIVISVFLFCTILAAQNDPDESKFINQIVGAFRDSSFSGLKLLIFSYEEYLSEVRPTMLTDSIHNITPAMLKPIDELYRTGRHYQAIEGLFERILKYGIKIGIANWKKVKFVEVADVINSKSEASNKKTYSIVISNGKENYKLVGVTARKYKSGFRLELLAWIVPSSIML